MESRGQTFRTVRAVHQPVNRVFAPLMPPLMTLAIFSGLATLVLIIRAYTTRVFALTAIGTLCSFVVAMSSLLVNVPINQEVLRWSPESPPSQWALLRDRWGVWRIVRTVVAVAALSCLILSLLADERPME